MANIFTKEFSQLKNIITAQQPFPSVLCFPFFKNQESTCPPASGFRSTLSRSYFHSHDDPDSRARDDDRCDLWVSWLMMTCVISLLYSVQSWGLLPFLASVTMWFSMTLCAKWVTFALTSCCLLNSTNDLFSVQALVNVSLSLVNSS